MKKTLLFLVFAAIIVLSGCKKPDPEPSCNITSPKNGAKLLINEDIIVSVEVEKFKDVLTVIVYLDDIQCGTAIAEPYTVTILSFLLTLGDHNIKAVAVNKEGKQAESTIKVSIDAGGDDIESPAFVSFTNGIIPPGWKTSTWVIENTVSYDDDNYSLKSSPLDISNVLTYKTMNAPAYVEFYTRGGSFDLHIDGIKADALSSLPAGQDWKQWIYAFDKGKHSFRWETKGKVVFLDVIKFADATLPTVHTETEITNITATTATSGGVITTDGNHPITECGICWSTTENPTINDNKTVQYWGLGGFESIMEGLVPNTLYYLRAYATNKVGTSYGEQVSFKTLQANLPKVETSWLISNITLSSATCYGTVTDDGNDPGTVRGICWSTSENPTITDNKTMDGTGKGYFTGQITGLNQKTTYFVRAYATNDYGTSYGEQVTFTTLTIFLPEISTYPISEIKSTAADCGGQIYKDGNGTISQRGVCWSTSQNPTTNDKKTVNGSGLGGFNSKITGLTNKTTYYVRAYATNEAGTAYGDQKTFTTSFAIGENYQGGRIAYIDNTGEHGFIAALSDQSSGIQWFNGNYIETGALNYEIGKGKSNTEKIVQAQGDGEYAAKLCYDLVRSGYDDWYLPSRDELKELYERKYSIGGFQTDIDYWSSTEYTYYKLAWSLRFSYGGEGEMDKDWPFRVRCIRYF